MDNQVLEKTIGVYGIFHFTVLDTYNVVNLKTREIMSVMNMLSVKDAEDYIKTL